MDKIVITLDSSQLVRLSNCPVQWYFSNKMQIAPGPKRDYSGATPMMESGTLGHKYLERYYAAKINNMNLASAMTYAMDFDPNASTCFCGHAKEYHQLNTMGEDFADSEGYVNCVCLHCDVNCQEHVFRPVEVIDQTDIKCVQARFIDYCMIWTALRDFEFTNENQLEVGFSTVIYEDDDRVYILEGRIDGLPTYYGSPCFIDHKWQEKKKYIHPKTIQFKNYALAAKVNMGYINFIRLAKETDRDTFQRVPISFNSLDHDLWKQKLIYKYRQVEKFLLDVRLNDGIPPPIYGDDSQCGGLWHPCSYNMLCDVGYDKKLVQILADTNYHKRAVWKPW